MGGDNLATLHKWKNYELILNDYDIYVYKRPRYELGALESHPRVRTFDAPSMEISATFIRQCVAQGKSIQYLVPAAIQSEVEMSIKKLNT
jgi:nicotinate-nucleotide adenylyltransferase